MRKIISILSILLFSTSPILAVEDCTVARAVNYTNEPIYQVNRAHSGGLIQLLLEISAQIFRRGKDQPVYYELADTVTYINGGATMRVHMRENCGWSDGAPITADEVIEGIIQTYTDDPISSNVGRTYIKNGTEIIAGKLPISELGVRIVDQYTFEIDILANGGLIEKLLSRQNFTPYPLHLSKSEQKIWGEGYLQRVSSGPYYVTSMDDQNITFLKNPHFCKDIQPDIEKLVYFNVEDPDSQIGLFLSKKINLAERFNERALRAFEKREQQQPLKRHAISGEVITFLLQSETGILAENPKLREALFLATDLDRFQQVLDIDENFLSRKGAISYPYPEFDIPVDPLFEIDYPTRLEQAKNIMNSFNYDFENPLDIKIVVLDRPGLHQVKNALQSMWRQINVSAKFEFVDIQDFSWKGLAEWPGGHDYFLVSGESDFPDPADFLGWVNIHTPHPNKEEITRRIKSTFKMVSNNERYDALREIELELRNNRAALSLYASSVPWIIDPSLEFGKYFYSTGINLKSDTCPSTPEN